MKPLDIDSLFPTSGSSEDEISQLRQSIMRGEIAQPEKPDTESLPVDYRDIEDELIKGMTFVEELNAKIDELKAKLLTAMETNGVKQWKTDRMTITRTEPSIRYTVDSKKLKAKYEDVYNDCLKSNETKAGIRITIKKDEL